MKRNKGFTLIELLVVIAIIGILSSVVLASLSNARDKSKDASVKSQMASLRAQGELYYSETGSYGEDATSVCNIGADGYGFYNLLLSTKDVSGVSVGAVFNATGTFGGTPPLRFSSEQGYFNKVTCHTYINPADNTSAWAAEAPLSNGTDPMIGGTGVSMYCVDSTGVSRASIQNLTALADLSHYVTCQDN